MASKKQWPGIRISEEDRTIIKDLQGTEGLLKSADMKDIFMIAAALAVKNNVPSYMSSSQLNSDMVHSALINRDEYSEYRQYIALIYYLTEGKKDLSNMSDTGAMVKNFINYGQRGLRVLDSEYLQQKDGNNKLLNEFVGLLK